MFTVGAAVGSRSPLAPLAIGAVLRVMVYAGGHLSGGHYNPAVTMAALVVRTLVDPAQVAKTTTLTLTGPGMPAAFVVELLFTYARCYVVLNVATSRHHPDISFYGLAIGFTVVAGASAVGAISGGAFNPAVSVGAAVMGIFAWPTLWMYLVGQVIAGAAAGATFLALNSDDR